MMFGQYFNLPIDITDEERRPPPRPITPKFPRYTPNPITHHPLTRDTSDNLIRAIARLRTPADVTTSLLERFNVHWTHDVPLADLLPTAGSNEVRHDDALKTAVEELRLPNDEAFKTVMRIPVKKGAPKRRVLRTTHHFFLALEEMSHYWDESMDRYYEVPDIPTPPRNGEPNTTTAESDSEARSPSSQPLQDPNRTPSHLNENGAQPEQTKMKEVYKGRRTANGASMPLDHLAKAVKGLLDLCARSFRIGTYERRTPAQLLIRKVKMPITLRYDVGRVPLDRVLARQENLEGPLMGVHVRSFGGCEDREEVLDCLQEVGVLLLVAQKRGREGRVEGGRGGEWWTTKRRWGGGAGGHMPFESDEEPTIDVAKRKRKRDVGVAEEEGSEAESASGPGSEAGLPENQQQQEQPVNGSEAEILPDRPSTAEKLKRFASAAAERDRKRGLGYNNATITNNSNDINNGYTAIIKPMADPIRKRLSPSTDPDSPSPSSTIPITNPSSKPNQTRRLTAHQQRLMDNYRSLKPPEPLWDRHIVCKRIGTPENAEWDEVYVLSGVNRHVSLLKMKVGKGVLGWVEGGGDVEGDMGGVVGEGERLMVQRSRWFDLFEPEERAELLEGLWRVFGGLIGES